MCTLYNIFKTTAVTSVNTRLLSILVNSIDEKVIQIDEKVIQIKSKNTEISKCFINCVFLIYRVN